MVTIIIAFITGALTAFTCFYFGLKINIQLQKGEEVKIDIPKIEIPNPFEKQKEELLNNPTMLDEYLNGPKEV